MAILRVTKEFYFEGAHALTGYDGKCRHIHGHSYRLMVTLKGSPSAILDDPKSGMVIDFSILKQIVNKHIIDKFDHALLLREDALLTKELSETYCNVFLFPFQPTCENLVTHFATIISNELPKELSLYSLRLYETTTSFVEWVAQDNI